MKQTVSSASAEEGNSQNNSSSGDISRRHFIGATATAALGLTVVPSHVLGGKGRIAPSDRINVGYIGLGTQGLRELPDLLKIAGVELIAVCDPQKDATGYFDWGPTGLRDMIRKFTENPEWLPGGDNTIPGGAENGKYMVDRYYANTRPGRSGNSCSMYADFREMFEKEKGLDAVKVMTPDHLHGIIAMAAMKRGKHVSMHKPLSNRLTEAYKVIEMASRSTVTTHLIPWDSNGSMELVMAWINAGVIGTLKEVHNWSNRPVWPQYATIPTEKPKPPAGLDWDLWLGPEAERPYHPHYTHMVFRGWYDFGGGAMADMGHYSLWTVFKALELENPWLVEPCRSHVCDIARDGSAFRVQNDFAFPFASTVRIKYPAKGKRPAVDLVWYDGGMRPAVPDEYYKNGTEFPAEGMMFTGDKGCIVAGFLVREPKIISGNIKLAGSVSKNITETAREKVPGVQRFITGCMEGKQIEGSFREAWPITEAVNLYAASLRAGKTLKYDPVLRTFPADAEAAKYLSRDYRNGWDPETI